MKNAEPGRTMTSVADYERQFRAALYDLTTGMAKTAVFAVFISLAACWKGLNTEGGTEGVGTTTTWVVVVSSVFIMVADFFLTKLFILTVYPRI
mgnify:CR=1 FL=1